MKGYLWVRVDEVKRVFYLAEPNDSAADLLSVRLMQRACSKGWLFSC